MRLAETWGNMCLIACIPASPKSHICWSSPAPPCPFGAVSQSYLRGCLLNCSPHFAPNKTFNSHIVHLSWQELKEDLQWDVNKIISIKDEDSGIRSKHSWGSNTLLNQKLIQWEIYHCSYLQIIILFSLTILPFHGNTLSKIVFSSSLWFVLQIPNWDRNKWKTSTRTSQRSQAKSCSSVDGGNYNPNEYAWCSLTKKLTQRRFWPFCLHVHTSWLPNESHTNVPDPIFKRNNNSRRGYQIQTLSQTWSDLKELQCPRVTYLFFHKNAGRYHKPISNTCPGWRQQNLLTRQ